MKRVAAATLSFLMLFGMFCTIAACGEQSDGCAHRGGKATCLEQAICEVCGEHYGTLAPHTYADEYTCHDRACLQEGCTHVEYAADEHVGGKATCLEQAICEVCGEHYGTLAPHTYADEYTCYDRACLQEGCTHVEYAAGEHVVEKYACKICGEKFGCTLEILQQDYAEEMLAQAKRNADESSGAFKIVILDKEETLNNIALYQFPEDFKKDSVLRGLFVRYDMFSPENGEILFTVYYNFGLEFFEEQNADVPVSAPGTSDTWYLEVVKGNPKLLFEFSIAQK